MNEIQSVKPTFRFKQMKQFEKAVIEGSDYLLSTSESLTKEYQLKFSLGTNITTIPNGIDTKQFYYSRERRERFRTELQLSNRLCFVYAGSMQSRQLPEKMARFFKLYLEFDSQCFFLGLTQQPQRFEIIIRQENIPQSHYLVLKKEHYELADYLTAGDIGFLFRPNNTYCRTSFPVKFAEYLASGIYVVASRVLEDIEHFVSHHQVGELLDTLNDDEILPMVKLLFKKKEQIQAEEHKLNIASLAKQHFDQERFVQKRLQIYQRLADITSHKSQSL